MKFELLLNIEEINFVLGALSKLPFGEVYKLIPEIQYQVKQQMEKKQEEVENDRQTVEKNK